MRQTGTHPGLRNLFYCLFLAVLISGVMSTARSSETGINEAPALPAPAERIITLAPHLAELVFLAGAGDRLIATVEYSNFPAEVTDLPRIGDAFRFDLEQIMALKPDLVIAWDSGNPAAALNAMEDLGLHVWRTEVSTLPDMSILLQAIGEVTEQQTSANAAVSALEKRIDHLRTQYSDAANISYFYQVAERPLYTVSSKHLISHGLAICGAENVFADLTTLAPQISPEAVISANPDVLIAGRLDNSDQPLAHWLSWSQLKAVKKEALIYLPADKINRATPRLLDAVQDACEQLGRLRVR